MNITASHADDDRRAMHGDGACGDMILLLLLRNGRAANISRGRVTSFERHCTSGTFHPHVIARACAQFIRMSLRVQHGSLHWIVNLSEGHFLHISSEMRLNEGSVLVIL